MDGGDDTGMFELKIVTHFSAAHQLKMVADKCENLHGHNWKVEVCLKGEQLNSAGILMDFGEIKKEVAEIMSHLDHKFLNDIEPFKNGFPPSSENIAHYIATQLQATVEKSGAFVSRVTAWESENACATYIPG
jgi:6-pyruvoyltetrahydropterin/6-carboxytetrahydropterin synthase